MTWNGGTRSKAKPGGRIRGPVLLCATCHHGRASHGTVTRSHDAVPTARCYAVGCACTVYTTEDR